MVSFDEVLDIFVVKDAFKAIELTMGEETKRSCVKLLAICTENLGRLYSLEEKQVGNQIFYDEVRRDYQTFKKCLSYMGDDYCKVYDEMNKLVVKKEHVHNLHDVMRNGLVHELELKMNHRLRINGKKNTLQIGVEYDKFRMLTINIREYFRDLKKGFETWKKEVQDNGEYDKIFAVMHDLVTFAPPQGGIGEIEDPEGNFVIREK